MTEREITWQRTGGRTHRVVITERVEVPLEWAAMHGYVPTISCDDWSWLLGGSVTRRPQSFGQDDDLLGFPLI